MYALTLTHKHTVTLAHRSPKHRSRKEQPIEALGVIGIERGKLVICCYRRLTDTHRVKKTDKDQRNLESISSLQAPLNI